MDDMSRWRQMGKDCRWSMPSVPGWKRLWGVRHVRVIWHGYWLDRHNAVSRSLGMVPSGYDDWVLYGIWHGLEAGTDD